jgi:hypothetical protein
LNGGQPFLLNGTLYCAVTTDYGYDHTGSIYEPIGYCAWSVTPIYAQNNGDDTIYTDVTASKIGDYYGTCEGDPPVFNAVGTIIDAGERAYSITDENQTVFYTTITISGN